jgi:hypothetical protein
MSTHMSECTVGKEQLLRVQSRIFRKFTKDCLASKRSIRFGLLSQTVEDSHQNSSGLGSSIRLSAEPTFVGRDP